MARSVTVKLTGLVGWFFIVVPWSYLFGGAKQINRRWFDNLIRLQYQTVKELTDLFENALFPSYFTFKYLKWITFNHPGVCFVMRHDLLYLLSSII